VQQGPKPKVAIEETVGETQVDLRLNELKLLKETATDSNESSNIEAPTIIKELSVTTPRTQTTHNTDDSENCGYRTERSTSSNQENSSLTTTDTFSNVSIWTTPSSGNSISRDIVSKAATKKHIQEERGWRWNLHDGQQNSTLSVMKRSTSLCSDWCTVKALLSKLLAPFLMMMMMMILLLPVARRTPKKIKVCVAMIVAGNKVF